MATQNYEWMGDGIKAWTKGVSFEQEAELQIRRAAAMPFVEGVAVMPDVHLGKGCSVGTVLATHKAIIPATVGVDIGCGMVALRLSLTASDLPDNLDNLRGRIEHAVPHGRSGNGSAANDRGAWSNPPAGVTTAWRKLEPRFAQIVEKSPKIGKSNNYKHLGSLGTGNHFIELCLDEDDRVWIMLHSGSRGVGNAIGQYFINEAMEEMERYHIGLPDRDLSYLVEDTDKFDNYIEAMSWAQDYAMTNREVMLERVLMVLRDDPTLPSFTMEKTAINCHHNYCTKEYHRGKNMWITRKGAVQAREGSMGIIPGSMGTGSFIVRGLGNEDSFNSCSHGAGRVMSRTKAKKMISMEDHEKAMEGISARRDADVLDESPAAYKDIGAVMAAQSDLIEIQHHLKQVLNIKG